ALQLSSHVTKTVSPTQQRRFTISEHSGLPESAWESSSGWFPKTHFGGGGYRDQHWMKEAFARVRSLTGGHLLPVVCTALLPKATIASDNSSPIEASLLTCRHLSISDYVTMKSVPPQVANGDNVLLIVHNLPEDLVTFAWFKGETGMNLGIAIYSLDKDSSMPGPGYSGRETLYCNGSLLLQNVNEKDTGLYTLQTLGRHGDVLSTTTMHLHVY
ncbi:hypothetical protein A6R68_06615, partial [Neotoma lepida]